MDEWLTRGRMIAIIVVLLSLLGYEGATTLFDVMSKKMAAGIAERVLLHEEILGLGGKDGNSN